mgnify:CR=1 FL=1
MRRCLPGDAHLPNPFWRLPPACSPLAEAFSRCAQPILGHAPAQIGTAFFSDASVFARYGAFDLVRLEELCASLPVEERIVDLPDDEKVNANGHALTCIGQEYIRTELVLERAKAKGVKHYRKGYADRELEQETCYAVVFKPVMPPPLLAHSYTSASVVTDALMKKVCGRHAPVPTGTDVETHGRGAEARHDGELGHSGV